MVLITGGGGDLPVHHGLQKLQPAAATCRLGSAERVGPYDGPVSQVLRVLPRSHPRCRVLHSGRRHGRAFQVEELFAAQFLFVGLTAAPQPEQPFGDQQIQHGGDVDGQGGHPGRRDALE